ncbi:MAG: hypothetical protein M1268_02245 [Patescibacteria group bacterium]|nr:hypothetical protein [Patescibacteria group bacterium]
MRKLILTTVFFVGCFLFLAFNIVLLSYLKYHKQTISIPLFSSTSAQTVAYAALPTAQNNFSDEITQEDARVEKIREFLVKYKSPLAPYAEKIVNEADKNNIDHRLLPAIAMQESNLCVKAPKDSYNCWGFGIYEKKVTRFSGFEEAIETVTKTLARDYINQGLQTPEDIQKKYTPSNNGDWAKSVNHFMASLDLTLPSTL